jgi:hypothetical protein
MSDTVKLDILRGSVDPSNPLALLRANPLVWSTVFDDVASHYKEHVDSVGKACLTDNCARWDFDFPAPTDVNVNMMPFDLMADDSLPQYLRQYWPVIRACPVPFRASQIAYLTVHESLVEKGSHQLRPGLHIERPGAISLGGRLVEWERFGNNEYSNLAWGPGYYCRKRQIPVDGIYVASTVDNSTAVYPCAVERPEEVTDKHGGIEHMRGYLPPPILLKRGQLAWITDRTPHENMSAGMTGYRQFFRLVVGRISVWHSNHNTPNPTGVLPNAEISHDDKFE